VDAFALPAFYLPYPARLNPNLEQALGAQPDAGAPGGLPPRRRFPGFGHIPRAVALPGRLLKFVCHFRCHRVLLRIT
jgi:hypothetical protein